jgi:hypothetical protein
MYLGRRLAMPDVPAGTRQGLLVVVAEDQCEQVALSLSQRGQAVGHFLAIGVELVLIAAARGVRDTALSWPCPWRRSVRLSGAAGSASREAPTSVRDGVPARDGMAGTPSWGKDRRDVRDSQDGARRSSRTGGRVGRLLARGQRGLQEKKCQNPIFGLPAP